MTENKNGSAYLSWLTDEQRQEFEKIWEMQARAEIELEKSLSELEVTEEQRKKLRGMLSNYLGHDYNWLIGTEPECRYCGCYGPNDAEALEPCPGGAFEAASYLEKMGKMEELELGIRGAIEDVHEFHKAIRVDGKPVDILQNRDRHSPALVRRSSRWRLLKEEVEELEEAIMENDIVEAADAYADIIYIVLGSAIMHIGVERFCRVWDEVQRSNMDKCVDGKIVMRGDGKVLKPEGWTPPDIEKALKGE